MKLKITGKSKSFNSLTNRWNNNVKPIDFNGFKEALEEKLAHNKQMNGNHYNGPVAQRSEQPPDAVGHGFESRLV